MNKTGLNMPGKSGFTLVEILIATVVFSIVITLLFSSFRAFMISTRQVKETIQNSDKMTSVSKRISLDIESIFIVQRPQYREPEFNSDPDPHRFSGIQEAEGQGIVSSLAFSSFAHASRSGDPRPGVARIAYYTKKNESGLLDLYRYDELPPYSEENRSCMDALLCTDISGFDIVYHDASGAENLTWDSESADFGFSYPKSIAFKIAIGSGDNKKISVVWIDLHAGRAIVEQSDT